MIGHTTTHRALRSLVIATVLCAIFLPAPQANAVTAQDWQAGRIIDDQIFTDPNSMSPGEIQAFLNSKVPECDTNGTKSTTRWYAEKNRYYTRAEWAATQGNPAPFTCLKDYYEVPKTQPGVFINAWYRNIASNQAAVNPVNNRVAFADINGDGRDEPILVGLNGTGSGMIEFHVWNSDAQSWQEHVASNQAVVNPLTNTVVFGDVNGDGRDEPVLVGLSGTGSGMVEFHVWNSANHMQSWSDHITSNQATVNPETNRITFADINGDGRDEPVLIGLSGTGSGKVEFHVWTANMNEWYTHIASNQAAVSPANNQVEFADLNDDKKDEPILVGLNGTGSGMVEFHVWNNNMTTWLSHIASNQAAVNPANNRVSFGELTGDGLEEPTLVGLAGTGSGQIELHIWHAGLPANNYGGQPIPAGARSAAQLIWDAAQQYRISPRVLLTTIQKESYGPLIVDDWPLQYQYTYALGAQCPDGPNGAECDPNYAGFSIQISESARLFRNYLDNMSQPWWPYKKIGTNFILWNVTGSNCGGANVNIQTNATAALYTYTPYQPNQAALSNMYGTGDNCSAYGNRNFWRIYNDWFGSSRLGCTANEPVQPQVISLYNPSTYAHFYTAYQCEADNLAFNAGYQNEGAVFNTTPGNAPGAMPTFRLYNDRTRQHFWTTDRNEVVNAVQHGGYREEGLAFFTVSPNAPNIHPVYRLYNPQTYQHVWTPSMYVVDTISRAGGFRFEGVAFYSQ